MSARGRRGLDGRVQKRLASREPMARGPAHPRPVWVWGESVKFGRPRPSHPTLNVFLGGAWFWRGLPCARCCTPARRWREEGRRHPMRVDWVPGFPSLVSHPPLLHPLPTALAHCPLPTAHSPTALAHPTLPQNHTHTHRFVRLRHHSQLFHFRRPSTPPPKPAALTTAHCSPRPCPGNSALHHHQPGP